MRTSRRLFLSSSALVGGTVLSGDPLAAARLNFLEPKQASGVKAGEMTATSAIVWARLTRNSERIASAHKYEGAAKQAEASLPPVEQLDGACPGAPGKIRVRYSTAEDLANAIVTDWVSADARTDFSHQFHLNNLNPDATYYYSIETSDPSGTPHGVQRGKFQTAQPPQTRTDIRFAFINCQKFHTREQPDGFHIYETIGKLKPAFVAFMGDNVYYDSDRPRAVTAELARYHWQRCYSLPRHVALLASTGTYWLKDDHDAHSDDVFPQRPKQIMGDFSFAEGLEIWRQQVPHDKPYRTVRWGRDLQIWLVEGRDFRSANTAPDGPEKSIWGAEQKAWLKETMLASDATWKLLLSPTPLVGPDRPTKGDNHANKIFAHEGNEMRHWFAKHLKDRFFFVNGDRHWQYHSVDPETGVNEFSVGAASDAHASGTPGYDPKYHRFHLVKGGFLSIAVAPQGEKSRITFELRGVNGDVKYSHSAESA